MWQAHARDDLTGGCTGNRPGTSMHVHIYDGRLLLSKDRRERCRREQEGAYGLFLHLKDLVMADRRASQDGSILPPRDLDAVVW